VPEEEKANKLLQQGIKLAKAGAVDEALKLFGEALDIVPGNPVVNYNFGLALQQTGSIEAAVIAYQAAIEVLPEFTEAQINLSYALKLLGRFSEALKLPRERFDWMPTSLPLGWQRATRCGACTRLTKRRRRFRLASSWHQPMGS